MNKQQFCTFLKNELRLYLSSKEVYKTLNFFKEMIDDRVDEGLSEEEAVSLGVNVTILRFIILMLATLVVSSIICVTGLISFIGLIAPHIARLLTKRNDIFTYITSGFTGAILLTLADILARSVSSSELPVSIFTSLLGAPLLIILLIRANKKEAL